MCQDTARKIAQIDAELLAPLAYGHAGKYDVGITVEKLKVGDFSSLMV